MKKSKFPYYTPGRWRGREADKFLLSELMKLNNRICAFIKFSAERGERFQDFEFKENPIFDSIQRRRALEKELTKRGLICQ